MAPRQEHQRWRYEGDASKGTKAKKVTEKKEHSHTWKTWSGAKDEATCTKKGRYA
jgi:hypothetical protein